MPAGPPGRRGIGLLPTAAPVVLALAALFLPPPGPSSRDRATSGPRLELGAGPDLSTFARATAPRPFVLPRDHGPHLEYQTEWWYYTGNVVAVDGRRFGFQLTFFRRGLAPGPGSVEGLSTHQICFAHFAITDVAAERHTAAERFSRGAGGLAGARSEAFGVWLEDWRAEARSADGSRVRLVAHDAASGVSLDLELEATKPLVAHGDRGLSPKSDEPGNASYYVGYTRMSARGHIGTPDSSGDDAPVVVGVEVSGEAWFDHEWSTSALGPGAVGWDWFSLQLDDGREFMHFQIRREDGSIEPVSGGTLVERNGGSRRLSRNDVTIEVLRRWTSPETGATYPSRWRLTVPAGRLDLLVEPWLDAQEMRTSFVYWEGAVRVRDQGAARGAPGSAATVLARPLAGQGYVELTGYAASMQGVF